MSSYLLLPCLVCPILSRHNVVMKIFWCIPIRNLVLSIFLLMSTVAVASGELEGLSFNGMALFSELKRPIYLAALYTASPQTDAERIINSDERPVTLFPYITGIDNRSNLTVNIWCHCWGMVSR